MAGFWVGLDREQLALVLRRRERRLVDVHDQAIRVWVVEHGQVTVVPAAVQTIAAGSEFHREGRG